MRKVFCCEPEGAEIDCPDCGNPAIENDGGVYCPTCAGN